MAGGRAGTWVAGDKPCPIDAMCPSSELGSTLWARLRSAPSLVQGQHGDNTTSMTKGASVCTLGAACLLHGVGVHQDVVHRLQGATSEHTELSPGSLPRGAATHLLSPALCDSHAGFFPIRTNGHSTCPALQLVLWLLPGHVHLQQRHRGLSGQGADCHPCQPARDHVGDVSTVPHHHYWALGGSRQWGHGDKPHSSATPQGGRPSLPFSHAAQI